MATETMPKILAVEDDVDTQANLSDILGLDGYCVETALTIREVLKRTNWSEYSVILLDRRLPDGTADILPPRLKQLAPGAAVIIMTGYADLDGTLTALRHGAADAHGGQITAGQAGCSGAEFVLVLPSAPARPSTEGVSTVRNRTVSTLPHR
jgi:DNA-binding NtrC family response regulator